jgi:serine/threonine protein kinase
LPILEIIAPPLHTALSFVIATMFVSVSLHNECSEKVPDDNKIKSFQLVQKLGQGHFGQLYKARSSLHGWVAVKRFDKTKVWESHSRGGRWAEILRRELSIHQE